jgi:heavy metal sensor kinase
MTPLSLKWRLTIPVAFALAVAMVVICALAYANFRELVLSQTDRSLVSAGKAIQMIMDDPATVADRPSHVKLVLAAAADQPRKSHKLEDEQQQLMTCIWLGNHVENAMEIGSDIDVRDLDKKIRGMVRPPDGQTVSFDMWTPRGGFRAVWMSVALKDGSSNIVVAQSTRELYGELHELLWGIILTAFIVVIAVIVMSGALIVLGLRPIRQTAEKLAGITAGNLGQVDWPSDSIPVELKPFVSTVRQMLDRLDASMRQQKAFISDAAHELRTPIAIAKSTMQVALATDRSEAEYRQALKDTTEDLRRLESMVAELLLLARLEEGGDLIHFQEVDLTQLLADLTESFQQRISTAGGKLIAEFATARISGDVMQLQRLFSNLLDNALRHGPAGGEIRLTLQRRQSEVEVIVHDQGGNIRPEDLSHLFDRFYRADNSRSHATGGVGLGLAIAKAITLRHGGTIEIESNAASGTSAHVTLPSLTERRT